MQQSFSRGIQRPTGAGDTTGEQLYHIHSRAIFAYIRLHLPGQEEAEDILLDVFLAALEQNTLVASMDEAAQRAWLRRVAHHKMVDSYRRNQRRPVVTLDAIAETLHEDERHSPEQMALSREERAQVSAIVAGLPMLQRLVVQLHFFYGLQSAEIAEVLGKREGTVRKLLWRALQSVRAVYVQKRGETHQ